MENEEGEIIEFPSSPGYQPLERPCEQHTYKKLDHDSSDDSPYDSDNCVRKRQKFGSCYAKKYNIWADCTTDDLLVSLDNISMNSLDRSRNVESYPYKRPYDHSSQGSHSSDNLNSDNYVRRHKYKPRKKTARAGLSGNREKPRNLMDLQVDPGDPTETIAHDIAKKLYEPKEDLILNVVGVLGPEKSIEIYYKTKAIESQGGLMVIDRSRRRTPGGVYLYLLRKEESISMSQKSLIFECDRKDVSVKKIHSLKRKRAKRRESSRKCELEGSILDNPPPSPATEADPIITVPLNSHLTSNDTDSDEMEIS